MPADQRNVEQLQRPPIRQSTTVRSNVEHVFDGFVRTLAAWWPLQPMSIGRDRVRDVTVEPRLHGRVFETWDDGTTVEWGRITVWSPPQRLVMTWLNTPAPTEVELHFRALGFHLTRVAVEHRGWEHLTDEQLREDCAAPGGYSSGAYDTGWAHVLALFTNAIETTTTSETQEPA